MLTKIEICILVVLWLIRIWKYEFRFLQLERQQYIFMFTIKQTWFVYGWW